MAEGTLALFEKYQEELKTDVTISQLEMKDSAHSVTVVKHKWVGRLMRHKIELHKNEKQREKALGIICERLGADPKIELSSVAIRKMAEKHDTVVQIDEIIDDQKLIIEYLEKVEKVVNSLTWDLKNIVDIVKQETQ